MSAKPQNPELADFIRDCERANGSQLTALKSQVVTLLEQAKDLLLARAMELGLTSPEFNVTKSRLVDSLDRARAELILVRGAFLARLGKLTPPLSPVALGIVLMDTSPLLSSEPFGFLSLLAQAKIRRTASMTPQEYQNKIGARIAEARAAKGKTRAQLAEAIGMTAVSVGRLETGKQRIASTLLYVIADALGVSLLDLLPKKHVVPDMRLTPEEIDLTIANLEARLVSLKDQKTRLRKGKE